MRKIGTTVVLLIFVGVVIAYLGYFEKPEDRVNSFVDAYNRQDLAGMIEMVDNPEVDEIKSVLNFTGMISESILGLDVADLLVNFLPLSEDLLGYKGSRMYANIQSTDMDLLRTEAKVYAEVTTELDNVREVESLVFYLNKTDRKWYITDIR